MSAWRLCTVHCVTTLQQSHINISLHLIIILQVGSGTTVLGRTFFDGRMSASEFEAVQLHAREQDGVLLRDREHAVYYTCFRCVQIHCADHLFFYFSNIIVEKPLACGGWRVRSHISM